MTWLSAGLYELLGAVGLRFDAFALAEESMVGLYDQRASEKPHNR